MKVIFENHSINSNDDAELQIIRKNQLKIMLAYPDQKEEIKGVVFYIAGFGGDLKHSEALIKKIAYKKRLAAVAIQYHCFFNRPSQGGY